MAGLHCTDCIYSDFSRNHDSGRFQGHCSRGYTLANPHEHEMPEMLFADKPEELVPVIDPFGKIYLRTSNVCDRFSLPGKHRIVHKHLQLLHHSATKKNTKRGWIHHTHS